MNLNDDDVKTALAWGSVSYAFGFVTVILHTWRLGFPLLDLLSARYVWIGLPLTVVAFFAKWIVEAFTQRGLTISADARQGWKHLRGQGPNQPLTLKELLDVLLTALPGAWIYAWLWRWLFKQEQLEEALRTRPSGAYVRFFSAFVYLSTALSRAMNALGMAVILAVSIGLYVWAGYPRVPQSLGGGLPASVQLVLATEKVEAVLPSLGLAAPLQGANKTVLTPPLQLLYATSADYYFETQSKKRFSLAKDAIAGILWNP